MFFTIWRVRYGFGIHSERWVVPDTGLTVGSFTPCLTVRNTGNDNQRTNSQRTNTGKGFLFAPSCGCPSVWNKMHDNGRDKKPMLVTKGLMDGKKEHFPWFGQSLAIQNAPGCAVPRGNNKAAYGMSHWNGLLGGETSKVSVEQDGWFALGCFFPSKSVPGLLQLF